MNGIATIGGSATLFQQQFTALSINLLPTLDHSTANLLSNCAHHAQQLWYSKRRGSRFDLSFDGPNREGALYCRSGTWLEILDKRTAETDAHTNKLIWPEYVRGTRIENSHFSVLKFISVAFGLVSIRGKESGRFLCMDQDGRLYAALQEKFSSECVFMEEMLENYYNLYSSCSYGSHKKPWYIALRRSGRPRKGGQSKKRNKSSHFLVVHFDNEQLSFLYTQTQKTFDSIHHYDRTTYLNEQRLPTPSPPESLSDILTETFLYYPANAVVTKTVNSTLNKSQTNIWKNIAYNTNQSVSKKIQQKQQRKMRLEREEKLRELRKQELQMKRALAYERSR